MRAREDLALAAPKDLVSWKGLAVKALTSLEELAAWEGLTALETMEALATLAKGFCTLETLPASDNPLALEEPETLEAFAALEDPLEELETLEAVAAWEDTGLEETLAVSEHLAALATKELPVDPFTSLEVHLDLVAA